MREGWTVAAAWEGEGEIKRKMDAPSVQTDNVNVHVYSSPTEISDDEDDKSPPLVQVDPQGRVNGAQL